MAAGDPKMEIAHVLTLDVVGYSNLLITEQSRVITELNRLVRETARFRAAEAESKLLRLPTGDGMVLVFFGDPEAPIECAMQISAALKDHPEIRLRMGIHSGPVNQMPDVNDRSNVAGAGIDVAQRVMDCGDAGHILLSKRVADDLAPFPKWNPHLHDLGECEVKHGRKILLVNFYTSEIGNPEAPRKCAAPAEPPVGSAIVGRRSTLARPLIAGASLFLIIGLLAFAVFRPNIWRSRTNANAAQASNRSIAVLPFENATNDPNADYLAEGISEALINSLTELQQLRVIARSTAFHYKGRDADPRRVGHELQVATVLTGKVRQMQDALSVQVDLVDAASGAQLWGSAFERKISDVIAVKQAIAREIAEKLKLKLSGEEARRLVKRDSTNPEANQCYLRGRYLWNKRTPDTIRQAIEQFQQAIGHDPNFALGYVGLADSYVLLQQYVGVPSSETVPKARAAADRALQIDDSLAEAHTSSAAIYQYMWKWAQAEQEFRRAISLNDNYATGHHWFCVYLEVQRQWDDALREIKRAQELDPLSPIIAANFALIYLQKNEIQSAIDQCEKIIALEPNHISGHDWLGWAYFKQGRLPEAISEREKVAGLSQRSGPQLSGVGYVYAIAGRREEALRILKELEDRYAKGLAVGQHLAVVCEGLGDRDQAFSWLEKDFQQRNAELQFITWRVQFEGMRNDPRYADLIRRMGLAL